MATTCWPHASYELALAKGTSMRLPVAVVGIPIVVITDTFYQVMVMPDPNDSPRDGEFCTSWPLLSETNKP
jgi:hypothetical protein